jgi:GPH family glycoside/pentoside/hexuronide:cation symporter
MDEDEVNQGSRRDGMFQGLQALFNKPAVSIGPIVATLILVSFGYVQGSDTQPESALLGITILALVFPAVVIAIALVFIYFYPLHGAKLEEMISKLQVIHKKKAENI